MRLSTRMERLGTESAFEVLARARALEAQGRTITHLEIGAGLRDAGTRRRRSGPRTRAGPHALRAVTRDPRAPRGGRGVPRAHGAHRDVARPGLRHARREAGPVVRAPRPVRGRRRGPRSRSVVPDLRVARLVRRCDADPRAAPRGARVPPRPLGARLARLGSHEASDRVLARNPCGSALTREDVEAIASTRRRWSRSPPPSTRSVPPSGSSCDDGTSTNQRPGRSSHG